MVTLAAGTGFKSIFWVGFLGIKLYTIGVNSTEDSITLGTLDTLLASFRNSSAFP